MMRFEYVSQEFVWNALQSALLMYILGLTISMWLFQFGEPMAYAQRWVFLGVMGGTAILLAPLIVAGVTKLRMEASGDD